ncbi:DUF4843 domain-containing protein [Pedobacter hiemivivus]|uniref:DUF4843 domain-containing protein n=1 Tax=Pedobacter hiemivivus TaxID=2530454 RepID=A0A4U1G8I0_9SPHI|nr:DUF4843 domain-containing protein [Pedobacter hiemivivus]TKC60207.1 DUF4843 domain-containing protein [Pedobacter hiemivivus]
MKNLRNKFSLIIAMTLMLSACKKDEVGSFTAEPAINFLVTPAKPLYSTEYSFMTNPNPEYLQEVEVIIIGNTEPRDRILKAVAVKDATTTAQDSQYEILEGKVKAGEFIGKLNVKLKNSAELNTSKVVLKLRLVDSEDFKVGNKESAEYIIGWTNQILVPNPWSYFQYYFTSKGSTAAYRIILQTTGLTKFTITEYRVVGAAGAEAMGTKFGDYVKQWNKDHPNDHLKHDDGALAGQEIVPLYYTHSKFD